jgi:hypothetical protein
MSAFYIHLLSSLIQAYVSQVISSLRIFLPKIIALLLKATVFIEGIKITQFSFKTPHKTTFQILNEKN